MQAIVLNGDLKSALCTVRSLGKQGISVSVGADRVTAMARYSRYCSHAFTHPSPYKDPDGFIDAVRTEAERIGGKPLVYAFGDATYLLLARRRNELEDVVTLLLPAPGTIEKAFDKWETYQFVRGLEIPAITTYAPRVPEEIKSSIEHLTYPCVIKTRHSVAWKEGKGVFCTAVFVHSEEELTKRFVWLLGETGEPPLIQPFVEGTEYGVEFLADSGKILAEAVHERIRSLRPTGGASVLKQTVDDNERTHIMLTHARLLVKILEWSGPIMIEFKVSALNGKPQLMEINGRFWGSLPLALAASVDFPYLYYKLAQGEKSKNVVRAKGGIATRHFLGDVRNLFSVWFASDRMRPYLYPSRMDAFKNFCMPGFVTKSDVFSPTDLKPSIMEYADILHRLL